MEQLVYVMIAIYFCIQALNAFVTIRDAEAWAKGRREMYKGQL